MATKINHFCRNTLINAIHLSSIFFSADEIMFKVATIIKECEPSLENSNTGDVHIDFLAIEPATVDALKTFINGLDVL